MLGPKSCHRHWLQVLVAWQNQKMQQLYSHCVAFLAFRPIAAFKVYFRVPARLINWPTQSRGHRQISHYLNRVLVNFQINWQQEWMEITSCHFLTPCQSTQSRRIDNTLFNLYFHSTTIQKRLKQHMETWVVPRAPQHVENNTITPASSRAPTPNLIYCWWKNVARFYSIYCCCHHH